ncbi:MAG: D-inositol-3-phosphate glycosyltransferase [Frankiaceae bacterium]|nr:D-inositol-3-phosphate glycosyltransferase [Frankiaceae bacterium]
MDSGQAMSAHPGGPARDQTPVARPHCTPARNSRRFSRVVALLRPRSTRTSAAIRRPNGVRPLRLADERALPRPHWGSRLPRRVAMLSVHTSPLDQPGTGDAGGMNVYVVELSRQLAALGIDVEIFTRATRSGLPPVVRLDDGVLVRHVTAGPYEGLGKADLPAQMCAFTAELLRVEATHEPGWYDLVHSHYWLSGQIGWVAAERWGVPLVSTAHTLAKVKNAALADGDAPEPLVRVIGEQQVVAASTRLVASTPAEARELIELYDAPEAAVDVVAPGVDLEVFRPGEATAARTRLGVPPDADLLLFVGRLQPLKAPDVLLRAAAELLAVDPGRRRNLVVAVLGGPSGNGLDTPEELQGLAARLGIADVVRFEPPVAHEQLADWYRAADVVVVPSHNESFGLVALEAQACGTPVVAAAVGGLRTAVRHEVSGLLIDGHDPADYAGAFARLLDEPGLRDRLAQGAITHAAGFGWSATARGVLGSYAAALETTTRDQRRDGRDGLAALA